MLQKINKNTSAYTLPDGRRLAYSLFGDPDGKPVLYFHGGVSSRLDIAFADEHCKSNGICIISPDRPGTGYSDPHSGFTVQSWVNDVDNLLSGLELSEVHLLGWSLAGAYVFACAGALPHRIKRAATVGATGPLDSVTNVEEFGLLVDRLLIQCPASLHWLLAALLGASKMLPPVLLKELILSELKSAADRQIVARQKALDVTEFLYESLRQGAYGVIADYKAACGSWGFELKDIQVEVQLWHGADDKICPVSQAHFLEKNITRARLELVPGQGHFLLHEHLAPVLSRLLGVDA